MDNLEEKIQSLLNSPDGMNQILNIARSLTGSAPNSDTSASAIPQDNPDNAIEEKTTPASSDSISAIEVSPTSDDSQSVDLAPATPPSSEGSQDNILSVLSQVDPAVIRSVMGLISEYRNTDDRRFRLLEALRPYMKEPDTAHIDKAIQIMRLSKVIKRAFSSNIGGENTHV